MMYFLQYVPRRCDAWASFKNRHCQKMSKDSEMRRQTCDLPVWLKTIIAQQDCQERLYL